MSYTDLPSIDDCVRFKDAINAGRDALGLEPVERFDFDACEPGSLHNCLSARHLFVRGEVEHAAVGLTTATTPEAVVLGPALGAANSDDRFSVRIPDAIKRVTDVFDHIGEGDPENRELRTQLRARMVEAGLVE